MEGIEAIAAQATIDDALQQDFDDEFDVMVSNWTAEQGEYSEARDCLDTLLEARVVMASMQAQEQRCLARLEAIALESAAPGSGAPTAGGRKSTTESREIAWRSMIAEIAVAMRPPRPPRYRSASTRCDRRRTPSARSTATRAR